MGSDKIKKVKKALVNIIPRSYHYEAPDKAKTPYAVWYEERQDSLNADDKAAETTIDGVVHYFTKKEYDDIPDELFEAFTAADICIALNSIQYEEDTKIIHYEWTWEL